jgi:hypothetical protein
VIDKLQIIQQFLLAASTFRTALGGDYVVINRVPAGFKNTHPLVVVTPETGTAHVSGDEHRDIVMARCYGGTKNDSDARAIFRALYDRFFLPGQTALAAGNIRQVFYLNDTVGPDDPDHGWPTHIGRFQIIMES